MKPCINIERQHISGWGFNFPDLPGGTGIGAEIPGDHFSVEGWPALKAHFGVRGAHNWCRVWVSAFAQPDNGSLVGAGLSSFPLPTFLLLVPDRGWVSPHNNHASDTEAGAANNSIRMHKRVNRQHFLDFGDMTHLPKS